MAIETRHETPLGPKALLAHLRDHPDARFKPPRELAQEFDLPTEFVEQVLTKAETQVAVKVRSSQKFYSELYALKKRLKRLMDDSARHPTVFVIGTTVLAELILLLLSLIHRQPWIDLRQGRHSLPIITGPGVVIPFLVVCAQMILFFRRGLVRFALYGALAYWLVGDVGLCWLQWVQSGGVPTGPRFGLCLLIVIAHLIISMLYATAGSFVSLMGEYQKVLRENRRIERMTRQELLERLFQLQARMAMAKDFPRSKLKRRKLAEFMKPRLFVAAAVIGFLLPAASNLAFGKHLGDLLSTKHQYTPDATTLVITGSVGIFVYVVNFWLSYLAPNLKTALTVGLFYALGGIVSGLLWLPSHSREIGNNQYLVFIVVAAFVLTPARDLLVSATAGAIAAIQTKTLEDLNIQRNDEATLIAEQLKIQWRLAAEEACSTAVMVVDVVKSTQMKDGADPLKVEYSFRRFQQWVEDICQSHGGSVRSTAGDSAIVSFPNCHNAFLASTEVQRRMPDFNLNWNRLDAQFRVRCGLHVGDVQGDLGKIQFAQVIDIAAHMQKLAPAGGIAATREIVTSLGTSSFVPLAIKSDGHDVFLALDPNGP